MSHYFINDKNLKSNEKQIEVDIFNKKYPFYTDSGVFAKNYLDYGSRLLLETLPISKMKGSVLDLGCGYGIIGLILKDINKLLKVDMVDINKRAITLATKNSQLNNQEVNIFESDIYSKTIKKYNYIITNPPIKAGKEIIKRFLLEASNHLEEEGELWFVMRKDHGLQSIIKLLGDVYKIEVMAKNKGFYIICAKQLAKN